MLTYLIRRLFLFIPTFIVISLFAFGLSKVAPGDPIEIYNQRDRAPSMSIEKEEALYKVTANLLGLDKPGFYFAFQPLAFPDTIYRFLNRFKRATVKKLLYQYGNWTSIETYYLAIQAIDYRLAAIPDSLNSPALKSISNNLKSLYTSHEHSVITSKLESIGEVLREHPQLTTALEGGFEELRSQYRTVITSSQRWKLYVPTIKWYGFDNQYHHWLASFLWGDFGVSLIDGREVEDKIGEALRVTLLMNGLAILLAFGLSIPVGVRAAVKKGKSYDRATTLLLFVLYSLPSFWIGTLLLVFFTTPEYGMDWFPTLGLTSLSEDAPFWKRFWDTAHHLVLPVFCLTYNSLAFISRQMRNSMHDELGKPYILTAWAKGLNERRVVWKHAFRNALFPIITLVASVFPYLLAGSFVVEFIFNIPGMGLVTIDAIRQGDWPTVYAVMMLSAIFTMLGILVADILYTFVDPRIKLHNNK